MLTKANVLVTGGAGFIGSQLCQTLVAEGYHVRVLDNLTSGNIERLPSEVEFVQGEIDDLNLCLKLTTDVSFVFHLAAMSRSGPSLDAFDICLKSNVLGTHSILEASKQNSVQKFIYSASSTCYGNIQGTQKTDTKIDLLNPYGWSKFAGESLAFMYSNLYKLPVISLRYFNVYGKYQPSEGAYALVLGIFLDKYSKGEPLEIHGGGNQRRDFVHVEDVALCNLLAANSSINTGVFNVGSGTNISIRELANLISSNQIDTPRRIGDAMETLADISETVNHLGWKPKISIQEGLANMMAQISVQNEA